MVPEVDRFILCHRLWVGFSTIQVPLLIVLILSILAHASYN